MDSVQGWVDKDHVRDLAEKLMSSPQESKEAFQGGFAEMTTTEKVVEIELPDDSQPDELQKGGDELQEEQTRESASTAPPKKVSSALAQARDLAQKSGAIVSSTTSAVTEAEENTVVAEKPKSPEVTPPEVKDTRDILAELDRWLRSHLGAEGVCIVDRGGDIVYDAMNHPTWTNLVVSLTKSVRELHSTQSEESKHFHVKVTGELYLQAMTMTTVKHGVIVVGALLKQRLTNDSAAELEAKTRATLV